jgi:hypothetical protein
MSLDAKKLSTGTKNFFLFCVFPLAIFLQPCDKGTSTTEVHMTKRLEFTPTTKAAIRSKGDCCWACGVPGWFGIEVDHIIPRCDAASHNGESNGQMLCSTCNNVKGEVTFAVKPRVPYWNPDQVAMMQQVSANRRKFATLIRRARARG